jgi:hypothetical protein
MSKAAKQSDRTSGKKAQVKHAEVQEDLGWGGSLLGAAATVVLSSCLAQTAPKLPALLKKDVPGQAMPPSFSWSVDNSHELEAGQVQDCHKKSLLSSPYTGVTQTVEALNRKESAGIPDNVYTDGYAIVFSTTRQKHFALYSNDAARKFLQTEFNFESKAGAEAPAAKPEGNADASAGEGKAEVVEPVWNAEQAIMLGSMDKKDFADKCPLLDEAKYDSVQTTVDFLNSTKDSYPNGLCAMFLKAKGQYVLLYRADKKVQAESVFPK